MSGTTQQEYPELCARNLRVQFVNKRVNVPHAKRIPGQKPKYSKKPVFVKTDKTLLQLPSASRGRVYRVTFQERLPQTAVRLGAADSNVNGLVSWGTVYGKTLASALSNVKKTIGDETWMRCVQCPVSSDTAMTFTIHTVPVVNGVSYKSSYRTCNCRFYADLNKNVITCGYGKKSAQVVKFPSNNAMVYTLDVTVVCNAVDGKIVKYTGTVYGSNTANLIKEIKRCIDRKMKLAVKFGDTQPTVRYVLCEDPYTEHRRFGESYRSSLQRVVVNLVGQKVFPTELDHWQYMRTMLEKKFVH